MVSFEQPTPAEDKERTFSKDPNGRINFTDNFWVFFFLLGLQRFPHVFLTHFVALWMQSDTPTGSGFDVLVLKHRNGKDSMKEVAEWIRERLVNHFTCSTCFLLKLLVIGFRAALEERYAKDLVKLAKSPLGDVEEG